MTPVNQLADGTMPSRPGDVSWFRSLERPPCGERDELYIVTPDGKLCALIPEVHTFTEGPSGLSVSPSVVNPNGGWHGFITDGRMT